LSQINAYEGRQVGGEGVAADATGNVFGAENVGKGLRKYAKQ
jgi:hypothetical protein